VTSIVAEVDVARPPDEVFRYVTDPSRFGEWQEGVVSAHIEGNGQAAGSRCVMTRRIGGRDRTSTSEITQVSPPRVWAIHGIDGPIRADITVKVEPRQDGKRSHVAFRLDFRGYGVGKLIVPVVIPEARKEVFQSCQKLKFLLESGTPA